jgi:parallel beta-helix repeat protein
MLEQRLSYETPKKRSWLRNAVLGLAVGLVGLVGGCEGCGENFAVRKAKEGAKVADATNLEFTLKNMNAQYVAMPKGKYFIDFDIFVPKDSKLEIEAGTELYFGKKAGIISYGTLIAVGTEKQNIVFSSLAEGQLKGNGVVMLSSSENKWQNIDIEGQSASNSILKYCTIKRGSGVISDGVSYGGGLSICNTAISIESCKIESNSAARGGGIYVSNSKLILKNSLLQNNSAYNEGGGIYIWNCSSPLIDGNAIIKNIARDSGGGIYMGGGKNNVIKGNNISGNMGEGGGMRIQDCFSVSILENVVTDNSCTYRGGGIHIGSYKQHISDTDISEIKLERNTIKNNKNQQKEIDNLRIDSRLHVTLNDNLMDGK